MNKIQILNFFFESEAEGGPHIKSHIKMDEDKGMRKGIVRFTSGQPSIKEFDRALNVLYRSAVKTYRQIVGTQCPSCEFWYDKEDFDTEGFCKECRKEIANGNADGLEAIRTHNRIMKDRIAKERERGGNHDQ